MAVFDAFPVPIRPSNYRLEFNQQMWNSIKKTSLLLLVLFLLSTVAYAQPPSFYGGLGYGNADYAGETSFDITLAPGQKLKDKANFIELYVGCQLNTYLSFEIGYADFGKVSKKYSLNPDVTTMVAVNNKEEIDFNRISLGALVEYPILDKLSVFGLFGYSFLDLDRKISGGFSPFSGGLNESGSDSEEDIFYGLGFKYSFTERLTARLQWTESAPDNLKIETFRFSVEMTF
jgi:opacity protein-like surface antigen